MKTSWIIAFILTFGQSFAQEAKPYLGISVLPTPKALAQHLSIKDNVGFIIHRIDPKGPIAKQTKLQVHDILLAINSQKLLNGVSLRCQLHLFKAGEKIKIHFLRTGKQMSAELELGSIVYKKRKCHENTLVHTYENDHKFTMEFTKGNYLFSVSAPDGKVILSETIPLEKASTKVPKKWLPICNRLKNYLNSFLNKQKNTRK